MLERSEKVSAAFEIDRDELSELLAKIAGVDGSVEERIARAARRLGWGYRRVKAHWFGEARRGPK